jgi:GNAT superfamily N-acetyltransferase
MAVRPLPRSSPLAELAAAHDVMLRCHAEANAVEPYRSLEDTVGFLRHPPATEPRFAWLAEDEGDPCGFARLAVVGNGLGAVEILVRPDARRRGHGRELLAAASAHAAGVGVRVLVGSHATAAGARFAAAVAATDGRRDVRSLLRLPRRFSPVPVDGYALVSWTGAAPAELVSSYALAREAINDSPRAAEEQWESWDVERVRGLEAALERRARDVRVTVAHDPAGDVVAFTELRISRTPHAVANTEDTAVVAEHRGRGLGRWIKAESLAALQRDRGDTRLVTTTNAEENVAMLALNRSLGFEPVALFTTCLLEL